MRAICSSAMELSETQSHSKKCTNKPLTPSAQRQPIWKTVSPISDVKIENKRKMVAKKAKEATSKPAYRYL